MTTPSNGSTAPYVIALMLFACGCEKKDASAMSGVSENPPVVRSASNPPQSSPSSALASTQVHEGTSLTLVTDRSLVCMVNNQFMGRPQIPVEVGGRTYYGCCEMCKGRLANDPASRTAVDPVSGSSVDKSVAVIGRAENGTTVYFETSQNFMAY